MSEVTQHTLREVTFDGGPNIRIGSILEATIDNGTTCFFVEVVGQSEPTGRHVNGIPHNPEIFAAPCRVLDGDEKFDSRRLCRKRSAWLN